MGSGAHGCLELFPDKGPEAEVCWGQAHPDHTEQRPLCGLPSGLRRGWGGQAVPPAERESWVSPERPLSASSFTEFPTPALPRDS